jgi:DNA topoisomerase VI B subunit
VELEQIAETRFRVTITDNGPGIVKAQIPKIFAKLLYGSKFHRLRMSRGQQGIGISAAGMYGQLTTGSATKHPVPQVKGAKAAHAIAVQIDTKSNKPVILSDEEQDWRPTFQAVDADGKPAGEPPPTAHGTSVSIDMEAQYQRGKQSVDEFVKQCAIVNPHLTLHYSLKLKGKSEIRNPKSETGGSSKPQKSANSPHLPRALKEHAQDSERDHAASPRGGTGHADADAEGQRRARCARRFPAIFRA